VDPLVKVFRDTPSTASATKVELCGGANEFISGQVAIRSDRALTKVAARWQPLRHRDGAYTIPADSLRWRFVGFVPVPKNSARTPPSNLARTAPCDFPDPLLEAAEMDVPAGQTQPIWLTVFVPRDAPPEIYEGQFSVECGSASQTVQVSLEVFPFVLPDERHVWVTNWFSAGRLAEFYKVKPWSEEHWAILERYGRNMASHRQNVVETPLSLVQATIGDDGRLSFDYARFDRWVSLFMKAGAIGRIELSHIARFGAGGWSSTEIILNTLRATDRAGKSVELPPEKGLAPFLANLEQHLSERGWLDKAVIHVADEPSLSNVESWKKASEFLHRAAPRLPRLDAIEARDFGGHLEIWIPKIGYLPGWGDGYRKAMRPGDELWFYQALEQGYYPGRMIDMPLVGMRVLHWINWGYRLDGYLHWGWSSWAADPFNPAEGRFPPGDRCIIYPGKDGPIDSTRWEMQREGLQDYEEFRLLAEKTQRVIERLGDAASGFDARGRSDEIFRRIVRSWDDYERNPAAFRTARRMLLQEIATAEEPPLVVLASAPAPETELVPAPIAVELDGVVEKGATVKMGGNAVEVRPDGRFAVRASPSTRRDTIELVVEHNGRTKTLQRHYRVRPTP
jgi:hypothetical protein